MRPKYLIVGLAAVVLAAVAVDRAADAPVAGAAPSIRGTYMLDYRELPDGKQLRSPEVIGMLNFTADHRNFNVYWTQDGKPVSVSVISKYTLSATEYTEENIYSALNNSASGGATTYDTKAATGKSPVKIEGGKISFKFPLHDEPECVFDSSGLTATRAGTFVDHWKKVD